MQNNWLPITAKPRWFMQVHTPYAGSSKHANKASGKSNNRTPEEKKHLKIIIKTTAGTSLCLSQRKNTSLRLWEWDSCESLKTWWRLEVPNSEQNRGLSATSMCTCSIRNKGESWLWTWECAKRHFLPQRHTCTHACMHSRTHSPSNQSITF